MWRSEGEKVVDCSQGGRAAYREGDGLRRESVCGLGREEMAPRGRKHVAPALVLGEESGAEVEPQRLEENDGDSVAR